MASPDAPFSVARSAAPWNWIDDATNPRPGPLVVLNRTYAFDRVAFASVNPRSEYSCLSGRIAIRLPPPVTQLLNTVTCDGDNAISPRITTSYAARFCGVTVAISATPKAFRPSA